MLIVSKSREKADQRRSKIFLSQRKIMVLNAKGIFLCFLLVVHISVQKVSKFNIVPTNKLDFRKSDCKIMQMYCSTVLMHRYGLVFCCTVVLLQCCTFILNF